MSKRRFTVHFSLIVSKEIIAEIGEIIFLSYFWNLWKMLNICFEVLEFKKKKIMKKLDKLLKFVIHCELFLQLRTPSFRKTLWKNNQIILFARDRYRLNSKFTDGSNIQVLKFFRKFEFYWLLPAKLIKWIGLTISNERNVLPPACSSL